MDGLRSVSGTSEIIVDSIISLIVCKGAQIVGNSLLGRPGAIHGGGHGHRYDGNQRNNTHEYR